ncbi:MAG: response regulator transcription factor [Bacteroidales bacterium]|nr:response regulator transcription factor [Bacteroidales bacterium]
MKILIVDDDPKIVDFVKIGLGESGFKVDFAYDGKTGFKKLLTEKNDLLILDVMLPDTTGIQLCRKIKAIRPEFPVIMLTGLDATEDKLDGFEAGADDYLTKPFEFKELLARIKVLLKRSTGIFTETNKLNVGDLELDPEAKKVKRGSREIDLTAREFELLEFLMLNRDKVVSRKLIAQKVWGISFDTGTNTINVYITNLRKKVDEGYENKLIHTKIGMGYIMKTD